MDVNTLPGKSRPQIARRAVHHSQQRRHIVRKLGARAPAAIVNGGQCVKHIDAFTDRDHGTQNSSQDHVGRRILRLVIRHQERSPIQIQSSNTTATANKTHGVRAVPVLRPSLCEIFGSFLNM